MYVFIIMRCVIVNDSQQDTAAFRLRLPRTKLYKCFILSMIFASIFMRKASIAFLSNNNVFLYIFKKHCNWLLKALILVGKNIAIAR